MATSNKENKTTVTETINSEKEIQELKETLKIDNVSLLDNLISVCYDNYTDKELYALLGIIRKKMEYQNKATCLIDSYYGIDNEHNILQLKL